MGKEKTMCEFKKPIEEEFLVMVENFCEGRYEHVSEVTFMGKDANTKQSASTPTLTEPS